MGGRVGYAGADDGGCLAALLALAVAVSGVRSNFDLGRGSTVVVDSMCEILKY